MSNQLSTTIKLTVISLIFPLCLSANKDLPPRVTQLMAHLDTITGIKRINALCNLAQFIGPYDSPKGEDYLKEADSLVVAYDFLTEEEKLVCYRNIYKTKDWSNYYKGDFYGAFSGSLLVDSIANAVFEIRDSLDNFILSSYLHSNYVRNAIYMNQKQYLNAQRELEEALEHCMKMENQARLGATYSNLGISLMLQDKYVEAEENMLKADSFFRARDKKMDIAYCVLFLSELYNRCGKWEEGVQLLAKDRGLIIEHIPSRIPIVNSYAAKYYHELGQHEKSDSLIAQCFKALESIEEKGVHLEIKEVIAEIYKSQERFEEAVKLTEDIDEADADENSFLYSKELLALQEKYEQSKIPATEKNSNLAFWILLGLIPLGILFYFLYGKRPPAEHTSHTLEIAWKDESPLEAQDPFLERFIEIVQSQMEDGKISVDAVAEKMRISRVQLFKKIKAITGKSPSVVIKQIRLETAERLLKANNNTIAEVAYKVGFGNPNSFSRAFKEHYGITPSDYLMKDQA